MKDAGAEILAHRNFDAGNLHGRVINEYTYQVLSYTDEIALWQDNGSDPFWTMTYLEECTKSTRHHLNVVQRAINNLLYTSRS